MLILPSSEVCSVGFSISVVERLPTVSKPKTPLHFYTNLYIFSTVWSIGVVTAGVIYCKGAEGIDLISVNKNESIHVTKAVREMPALS